MIKIKIPGDEPIEYHCFKCGKKNLGWNDKNEMTLHVCDHLIFIGIENDGECPDVYCDKLKLLNNEVDMIEIIEKLDDSYLGIFFRHGGYYPAPYSSYVVYKIG